MEIGILYNTLDCLLALTLKIPALCHAISSRVLPNKAFHIFVLEKVDVVLLEVGIGGQYDSTNVVRRPVVCGIASLDLDHTNLNVPQGERIV